MASARGKESASTAELRSLPGWMLVTAGKAASGLIVWGLTLLVFAAVALFTVPQIYPAAEPFLWVAIWGNVMGMLQFMNSDRNTQELSEMVNSMLELNKYERYWYASVLMVLVIGAISVQVTVFGVIGALIAGMSGFGVAAVIITMVMPIVDAHLSRTRLGWNVASTGALFALGLMYVASYLQGVSPSLTLRAGRDARRYLLG